jgi:hypothetical protein
LFFVFLQALDAAKSGLVLFHEAMQEFNCNRLEQSFGRFERAAAKGHEESIWICRVVKDAEMKVSAWKEAFAKTDEPLGYYFAGKLSALLSREQFDFCKKSAEGGCSWGQVQFGLYFDVGKFVEKDQIVYLEWLEKAGNQNNPEAMNWLGIWFNFGGGNDKKKAGSYFRAGAEMGWRISMCNLTELLRSGEGGVKKDFIQATIWGAKGGSGIFWDLLNSARFCWEKKITEHMTFGFDQLCYSLGWGLYWYLYDSQDYKGRIASDKAFSECCIDYYCSRAELQDSIVTFLLFWNQTMGVKDVGMLIGRMAWEERKENVEKFLEKAN